MAQIYSHPSLKYRTGPEAAPKQPRVNLFHIATARSPRFLQVSQHRPPHRANSTLTERTSPKAVNTTPRCTSASAAASAATRRCWSPRIPPASGARRVENPCVRMGITAALARSQRARVLLRPCGEKSPCRARPWKKTPRRPDRGAARAPSYHSTANTPLVLSPDARGRRASVDDTVSGEECGGGVDPAVGHTVKHTVKHTVGRALGRGGNVKGAGRGRGMPCQGKWSWLARRSRRRWWWRRR
mmetsp:Transcript_24636/g.64822  ORF Transcript_24636/g.64822 Transcript_24636/m.64822 type:complete len:243 (+) Transcript_24636:169-897(+)